jgi:hypothetical protein
MSHWVLIAVVVGIVVLAALSCFLNYLVTGKGTVSGTDVAASRVTPPLFSLIPVLLFAVLFGSFPFTKFFSLRAAWSLADTHCLSRWIFWMHRNACCEPVPGRNG